MTDVGTYLLSQLNAGYTKEPIDYTNVYEDGWMDRLNGTMMPASPGVDNYRLDVEFTGDELYYNLDVEWRPVTRWLVKQLPLWQVTHRSRTAVISASPLRVAENRKRVQSAIDWQSSLRNVSLSPRLANAIYDLIIDRTLKYLKFDREYIAKYIKDHSTSSFGGNYRWGQTTSLTNSEWKAFYEQIRANLEQLRLNKGRYLDLVWKTGLRARSPAMDGFTDHFSGSIDRSRIITFHPYMSSWNIFLTDKKAWYHEILLEVERLLDVKPEVHYPYVEGGQIYVTASDLFQKKGTFYARDGKSWDAVIGTILGPVFNPLMVYMKGITVLPSGAAYTSLLGTIANLVVSRHMRGAVVMLGDDNNQWVEGSTGAYNVPWIEYQPEDTAYKFILGLSFDQPNIPRIIGIKVMSDRAAKNIPLRLSGIQEPIHIDGKHTPQEISVWAGMYLGRFGSSTLLERLRKQPIELEDYISPGQIIEDVIKKPTNLDTFAWAEELGVKKIVVA